ncbi:MAG TPA: tetratricopeptide repeat protein, partial [Gemmataceae bacterium]|nr:tetratricopeptide repeat protein [Gemmataceae bacterium]
LEQQSPAAADHFALFDALASAYSRLGQAAEAKRLWEQLAEERQSNLAVRLLLFDLAKQAGHAQEENRWKEDLRTIEGANGSYWRYAEAGIYAEQLARNKVGDTARAQTIDAARADLLAAAERRPSWYRIPALQGEIEMVAGDKQKAITYFQDAVDKGDRRPNILRQLVQLLYQEGRVGDADKIVHKMLDQRDLLLAAGLGKMAAESMLRAHDDTGAMALAEKSGAATSKNYLDHLWLSSLAWSAGKRQEARTQILRARDMAPDKPEPWSALVAYEMRTDNKQAAEAAIEEARKKLPKDQAALTLASCYEVVGNLAEARKQYEAAQVARPDDTHTVLAVATFYLRDQQTAKAETALRHVVEDLANKGPGSEVAAARRELALILASNISTKSFVEALALVDSNIKGGEQVDADKRIKARLLSTRLTQRQQAISLFEDLKTRVTLTPDELQTLAQLYEAEGNWINAKLQLITLLNSPAGKKPVYERYYARRLLAHQEVPAAADWVAEVEKAEPDAPSTIELKARLLAAQDKPDEAVNLLVGLTQRKDIDQGGIAVLLEALGRQHPTAPVYLAQAKEVYESYVNQDRSANRLLVFAAFLARQKDLPRALSLCQQAMRTAPLESVLVTAEAALRTAGGKGELERKVEGWFEDGLKKKPGSVALLIAFADLRDYQGRYTEAAELYKRALQAPHPPLVALNNLAWLLAYQPNGTAEAKDLIQKAIAMVGETPELLDTRATIAMKSGDADRAITDLRQAVKLAPSTNEYVHLAEAYWLANNPELAKEAWGHVQDPKMASVQLHPLERPLFQRVSQALGLRTAKETP